MNGSSKISGNTASSNGGGVNVGSGASFTMNGSSEISGNTTGSGGGVYLSGGGTFTMNGGTISGNTASGSGGGVYVSNSTFRMAGGTISGNKANGGDGGGGVYVYSSPGFYLYTGTIYGSNEPDASLKNTAASGAALFRGSGYAYLSTNATTWPAGTALTTTNDTINAVEGVIVPLP